MGGKTKAEQLLGLRIRELRKKRGLTQEELGEKSGVNYKYIGSIERGLENPSFKHLLKIARALGVELSELFEFEHTEPKQEVLIKEINWLVSRLPEQELRIAYKMIETMPKQEALIKEIDWLVSRLPEQELRFAYKMIKKMLR